MLNHSLIESVCAGLVGVNSGHKGGHLCLNEFMGVCIGMSSSAYLLIRLKELNHYASTEGILIKLSLVQLKMYIVFIIDCNKGASLTQRGVFC